MAKIETTAADLQWKSNMIISAAAASEWDTDEKYPSAKAVQSAIVASAGAAVCDVANAIGSIIITSTNTNPATTLGGTWELIDKGFKCGLVELSPGSSTWHAFNANLSVGRMSREGHLIFLQLWLNTTDNLTTGSLGILNRTACGLDTSKNEGNFITTLEKTLCVATTEQGGGNTSFITQCFLRYDGHIELQKVFPVNNNSTLPAKSDIYFDIIMQADWRGMLDSACDKFYWKRTA
jgi:hypothetical protein